MLQKYKDNVYTTTLSQFRPNFAKGILRSKGFKFVRLVFFFKRIRTVLFSRGSYISDIYQNTFTTLKSANFNQTSHTSFLCEWDEWLFKGKCQREIIGELQKCIDNIQNSFSTETLGKYQQVESILG